MSIFNFGKEKTLNIELNCRQAALQLHDRLITTDWKNLGVNGKKPEFHKPRTKYNKNNGKCLLLTGYTFSIEDEHGYEEREVIKVIDVTNGNIIEELRFGWGHDPYLGKGRRNKDHITIEAEEEAIARHKQLLFKEFGAQ